MPIHVGQETTRGKGRDMANEQQGQATAEDFTKGQRVRTSMPYFENLTGTVLETPKAGDETVTIQMDEATQWHDDESGGELYTFEPQWLTVIE